MVVATAHLVTCVLVAIFCSGGHQREQDCFWVGATFVGKGCAAASKYPLVRENHTAVACRKNKSSVYCCRNRQRVHANATHPNGGGDVEVTTAAAETCKASSLALTFPNAYPLTVGAWLYSFVRPAG